jgi:nickel-type superoxide dismutase maturation protease
LHSRHYYAGWKLNVQWYPINWPLLRTEVTEDSMLPALRPGDWLLARRTRRIRPGQVVLAWHPDRPGFLLVKRAARRVEDGWWLVSDNPAAGAVDSSRFGPVREELIVGRVLTRYWRPGGRWGGGKPPHAEGSRGVVPPD